MPSSDTARLVAELSLDSKKFSAGMASANKSLGTMEKTLGKAGQGAKTFGRNIGLIGVAAAGGIAVAVKGGLDSLAELETAITSVDGAIAQMGLTGQLTGKQVADWANQIESDIGAAFDDKEITAAATTLLRFGKVTPKNLQKTLEVMTDLAVKTGDVESASNLLAKALADPTKAAGKLSKAGIVLTKAQQDQIKAMVEANDVAGAQALILGELEKATKGAAAASQGPYQRSLSILKDVTEDAQKALAVGFLPVIQKVADLLSKELAKPETLANIQKFGEGLAGGLDDLIEIGRSLPWGTIGDSLKIAGAGAQAVLRAFVSLPPWVQTAVLTGWGLNKLTGGALGGIVGELGKGLIKGVLGMNAGVVNINAGVVNGAGGVPTPGGGGAGVKGALTNVFKLASGLIVPVAVVSVGEAAKNELFPDIPTPQKFLPPEPPGGAKPFWELIGKGGMGGFAPVKGKGSVEKLTTQQLIANERLESIKGYTQAQSETASTLLRSQERTEATAKDSAARGQAAAFAIRDKVATSGSLIKGAVDAAKAVSAAGLAGTRHAAQQTAAAVRDKDLSVKVNATVNVSNKVWVGETIKTQTTFKKLGGFIS